MNVSPSQVLRAVEAFNARYGQMESVLWRLSTEARRCLLHGERPEVAEALVWTIRSWWGLQGEGRGPAGVPRGTWVVRADGAL